MAPPPRVVGRYALCREIAAGGMATVHLGRLIAEGGFARTVAIKRLLPQFAKDEDFCTMFLQEARLATRIRHPNVVPTLDVVSTRGELFLVMDYVHGESLGHLIRLARKTGDRLPQPILVSIVSSALQGLHAAHEATTESGELLNLVHRDVSPQNLLVDVDGVARVIDFGVAKAVNSAHTTQSGQLKGKLKYMAPEQILGGAVSRRTDVFAAGIILWEGLTSRRLFDGEQEAAVLHAVLHRELEPPSRVAPDINAKLDAVAMRALQRDPDKRFASAGEMSAALEAAMAPATQRDVGDWVKRVARERLSYRRAHLAEVEQISSLESLESAPPPAMNAARSADEISTSGASSTSGTLQPSGTGSAMSALSVSAPQSTSLAHARKKRGFLLPAAAMTLLGVAAGIGLFVMLGRPDAAPGSSNPTAEREAIRVPEPGEASEPSATNATPPEPSAKGDASSAPTSAEGSASAVAASDAAPTPASPTPAPASKPALGSQPAPRKPEPKQKSKGSLYSRD